jgi:hypothetical protein
MGSLDVSQAYGPSRPVTGIALLTVEKFQTPSQNPLESDSFNLF